MHLVEAIALRDALDAAIEKAEEAGSTEVILSTEAAALDDAARAELDQAIKDAE